MENEKQLAAEEVYKIGGIFMAAVDSAKSLGLKVEISLDWNAYVKVTEIVDYTPQREGKELWQRLKDSSVLYQGVQGPIGQQG